ncbi:MAG: stage III sporulation protein AE [Bacillota bacterium]|nr:stage III sporulation protein AE [Bacillota bacterium]
MKKILILVLFMLLPLILPVSAWAQEEESVFSVQDAMKSIDMESLEEFKGNIDGELSSYMETKSVKEWLLDFIHGEWVFDGKEVVESIVRFFFKEILANSGLLSKLVILSVMAALLINLQTAFSSSIAKLSYLTCFLGLCALALGSFKVVLMIGQQTIDNMVTFMTAMLPQMMVLVAGLGNINASVMLFPMLMTAATAFASGIKNVVFPLIILSAVLSLVNQMSETIKVEKMARFCTQLAQLFLGFFLTFFVGLVTLRALYASVLDKVTLRTTRFITDNAVPIVGKMVSDTIEVAAGYIVMLKQALGIWGVLIILGIILFPLLKIAAIAIIYKVVAAVVEPMGDARTAAILETMSSHILLMLAATASVALMFFFMIAIIAGMSNGFTALR